jgi:hypothetical protein
LRYLELKLVVWEIGNFKEAKYGWVLRPIEGLATLIGISPIPTLSMSLCRPTTHFPRAYGFKLTPPSLKSEDNELIVLKCIKKFQYDFQSEVENERAVKNFGKELEVFGHPPLRAHPNLPNIVGIALGRQ